MISILYFIPSLSRSGGMERVLCEKVNYMESTGKYNIFIVTTDMLLSEHSFFKLNNNVKLIKLELNYNKYFLMNFLHKVRKTQKLNKIYKEEIKKIVNKYSVDICITMGGKELEFLGSLNLPCKTVYESHFNKNFRSSFLVANGKNNLFWNIVGKIRDFQHDIQVQKINQIVVLTNENLKAWEGVSKKIQLIPNPSPLKKKNENSPNLDSKRIIAIGKLDVQKGYDMLLDAWYLIANKFPEWRLDIYGQGGLQKKLQEQIENLNLAPSTSLCGITKNVEKELYSSAFFVMTSRFEGLPMVLIESITCGVPLVSFDCETGPREIIQDNDCGILVESGNVKNFAVAIEKMILDVEFRAKCSNIAFNKSRKYELNYIMEQWEGLFKELLD